MTAPVPNIWRYVSYEDDGHVRYQCLPCKGIFTTGETPGYMNDGVYVPAWHFCPLCGIQWAGMRVTGEHDMGPQYGERRRRIREAEQSRYCDPYRPSAAWVIERLGAKEGVWRAIGHVRRSVTPAKVRAYLDQRRRESPCTKYRARIKPWADVLELYVSELFVR